MTFYDLNNDLTVTSDDVTHLVETILGTNFGDANLDRAVDGIDFDTWNNHKFQSCTGWAMADFNGDGSTDGSDFNVWNSHKFLNQAVAASDPGSHRRPSRAPLHLETQN